VLPGVDDRLADAGAPREGIDDRRHLDEVGPGAHRVEDVHGHARITGMRTISGSGVQENFRIGGNEPSPRRVVTTLRNLI
jgi:hypothetical protein